MVLEKIKVQLELLTGKFNKQMDKSRATLGTLNKSLVSQNEKLGIVNSKIKAVTSSIASQKNLNKKMCKQQKEFISGQKGVLDGYKVERTAISNSMSKTRESQALLGNQMKNRTRLFNKKRRELKESIVTGEKVRQQTQMDTIARASGRRVMAMSLDDLKKYGVANQKLKTRMGKAAFGIRDMTHGMRGFKMEALGVMFFGMAMQRMFTGLLRPVMEAFGVFDLFRIMLLVLFLPIMEVLFPYFLKFIQWFMDLPEPVKKAIGIFVLVGAVLGFVLFVIGTLALGIGSLILMFGGPLSGVIAAVVGLFTGFSAVVLAVVAIVIVIFVGMYMAWKENFLGMKKIVSWFISGFKDLFSGIIKFFKGIFLIIKGIFLGDWGKIWEGVKWIFIGAGQVIWGIMKILVSGIGAILVGIIRIVWSIIKLVLAPFIWLYNKIVGHSIIPDMIREIIKWFWKLPKSIFDMFKSIVTGMFNIGKDLMQKLIDGVKSVGSKVLDAILGLFPEWMRNGIKKAGTITVNIVKSIKDKVKEVFSGGSSNSGGSSGSRKDKKEESLIDKMRREGREYLEKHPKAFNDFIWRPGQDAISINPNDTLVGFKGAPPSLGGKGEVSSSVTNNFYGFTMDELKRELDDRDRRVVDDLMRLVKV